MNKGVQDFSPFDSGITSGINAPANVSASDGQYIDRVQVSFQGVAGVQGYEVFRSTSNNLAGAVLLGSAATSIYQDTTAISGVLYYYWVRGYNTTQLGPTSDSDSGSRSNIVPPANFGKASPVFGAPNQLSNLNFSWGPSAGAVSYEFCLDTHNDAHCNGAWTNTSLNPTITLPDLAPNLTYYWQVRAINSNGMTYANGASAAWWSFSTHSDCFLLTATHTGSGANPTVSPDRSPVCASSGSFVAGENITLTNASADPAWRISGWAGTNNDISTAVSNSLTMSAGHASVLVNYVLNCFTLTISKSGPGTLPVPNPSSSVGCAGGKYAPGEVISLSGADADTGYYISGWTGTNNNTSTSAGNSVTMPGGNHTAGVTYSPECYSLNFDIQPTGAGIIDWDYPDRCDSGAFPYGTIVAITAVPTSANYRFLNWSGHLSGSANPTQITMNGDKVVNVYFEQSTFIDVPFSHPLHAYIETLWDSGYTKGCKPNPLAYCPEQAVTRAEMAVFLERGLHGPMTTPLDLVPTFVDTPGHWAEDWIEALFNDGLTKGCGEGKYCPENPTTRAEMAVFLLRAKYGAAFIPPTATGIFNDVNQNHWAVDWIEKLFIDAITTGCNISPLLYCPEQAVTRSQMAAFLVRTFELP